MKITFQNCCKHYNFPGGEGGMLASKLSGGMFAAYPPEDQTSAFDLRLKNPRSAPEKQIKTVH